MKPASTLVAAATLYAVAALPSFAAPGGAFTIAPVPSPVLGQGPAGLAIFAIVGAGYLAARAYRKRN